MRLLFSYVGRLSTAKHQVKILTLFGTFAFQMFCQRVWLPSGVLLEAYGASYQATISFSSDGTLDIWFTLFTKVGIWS
jgi:hypothetical protein